MAGLEQGWGLQVVLWFQSWRTPLVADVGVVLAFMGTEEFWLPALALVYWCLDAAIGRRLAILFVAQSWLNCALKEAFGRPRPYFVSKRVQPVQLENSPGLPSGHAQTAASIGGAAAVEVRRAWVSWAAGAFMVLMAISRVSLGVHYPQDVVGGLLIGLALAGGYAWLGPRAETWLSRQELWMRIGLAVMAGIALLAIHPLLIPAAYPDDSTNALSAAGALIGLGAGFALEARWVRFSEKGDLGQLALRFVVGIALALAVRFGLAAIFGALEPVWLWRVIRYTCIGLAVSWLAPALFVRIGLAGRRGA